MEKKITETFKVSVELEKKLQLTDANARNKSMRQVTVHLIGREKEI